MDFIDYLNKAQEIVAVILVAVPTLAALITSLLLKLGRLRPIIKEFLAAIKDKNFSDEEMATLAWMFISIFNGWLPNKSTDVLKLAPAHQIKNMVTKGFITQGQADKLPPKGE